MDPIFEEALRDADRVRLGGRSSMNWHGVLFWGLENLGCKRFKNEESLKRWFKYQFEVSKHTNAADLYFKAILGPGSSKPLTKAEIDKI